MSITPDLICTQLDNLKNTKSKIVWIRSDILAACVGNDYKELVLSATTFTEEPRSDTSPYQLRELKKARRIGGYQLVQVVRVEAIEMMSKALIDKGLLNA